MKFTILFACVLFAVASAGHSDDRNFNPFAVLPVDVEGPEDRGTTEDDWVAAIDRTTTRKPHVPVDLGMVGHEEHEGETHNLGDSSTSVPVKPTNAPSTTAEPEASTTDAPVTPTEPTTTSQPDEPTTSAQPDSTTSGSDTTVNPTDVPTTSNPTGAPTTGPTDSPTTGNPTTSGPTDVPTTSGPTDSPTTTGPTDSPTTNNPTTGNPTTENPTTENPTTIKPDGTTTNTPATQSPSGWSTGSIAGVVIGSLFGAAMVVGGILFVSQRMKARRSSDRRPLVEA